MFESRYLNRNYLKIFLRSMDASCDEKMYFPKRKIVIVSIELEDDIDYALEPVKFFSKHRIRMLSIVVQSHPERPLIYATLFLDLTESDLNSKQVVFHLSRMPYIKEVKLLDIPLTHGEARLAVHTLDDLHYLFSLLKELGAGGLAIMYHMGFRAGSALAERISPYFKDNKKALEYALLYYESLGHGIFEIEKYIEGSYCRIKAREMLECLSVKSEKPNSQIFRGLLAGFLSKLWNEEVHVKEVKCITLKDPYCLFEAKTVQ